MKKPAKKPQRGGTREGAGRPSLGKVRVNLTLDEELVQQARGKEDNLSGLIDQLLRNWLNT